MCSNFKELFIYDCDSSDSPNSNSYLWNSSSVHYMNCQLSTVQTVMYLFLTSLNLYSWFKTNQIKGIYRFVQYSVFSLKMSLFQSTLSHFNRHVSAYFQSCEKVKKLNRKSFNWKRLQVALKTQNTRKLNLIFVDAETDT